MGLNSATRKPWTVHQDRMLYAESREHRAPEIECSSQARRCVERLGVVASKGKPIIFRAKDPPRESFVRIWCASHPHNLRRVVTPPVSEGTLYSACTSHLRGRLPCRHSQCDREPACTGSTLAAGPVTRTAANQSVGLTPEKFPARSRS